jgi:hypothetical protein
MAPEPFRAEIRGGVGELPEAEWTACLPDETEGWGYYRACEANAPRAVDLGAATVSDAAGLAAAVPIFRLGYRLDTPLQGRLRDLAARLRLPVELSILAAGSPYAERCHLAVRPDLDPARRGAALLALARLLENAAEEEGRAFAVWKDVAPADAASLRPVLYARGNAEVASLPLAVLDLAGCEGTEGYLARLSKGTRKDVRRKLRSRARFRIEHRTEICDVAERIASLYESTRLASEVRYGELDALPRGYFAAVAKACGGRARHVLYWVGEELVGFNLLFLEPDRVIDKFLGMAYPRGPQNDLYAVSWIENVGFALSTGRRYLQTGQTAYGEKLRLGSGLVPSAIFARARRAPLRPLLRAAAPLLAFDRWDPQLRRRRGAG